MEWGAAQARERALRRPSVRLLSPALAGGRANEQAWRGLIAREERRGSFRPGFSSPASILLLLLLSRARPAAGANLPNGVESRSFSHLQHLCASAGDRDTGRCPHLDSIRATPDSSLVAGSGLAFKLIIFRIAFIVHLTLATERKSARTRVEFGHTETNPF